MSKNSPHSIRCILLTLISSVFSEKGAEGTIFGVHHGFPSFVHCSKRGFSCQRSSTRSQSTATSKSFKRLLVVQQYRNQTIGRDDADNSDDVSKFANSEFRDPTRSAQCENEQNDFVGAGTFGDIMSDPADENDRNSLPDSPVEIKSGLVTSVGGTLQSQFGYKIPSLSPLDRIALTANGNLQRIFSSYYDAPVHVHVVKCDQKEPSGSVWHRRVNLSVFGQTFCTAESVVTVHSSKCRDLIMSGEVGIGQLFRYLDKLPKFTIIDAGRSSNGGLWRCYTLECNELTCKIREEFSVNAWEICPRGLDHFDDHDNTF